MVVPAMTTLTPGKASPPDSVTVPEILPFCAAAKVAGHNKARSSSSFVGFMIRSSLCLNATRKLPVLKASTQRGATHLPQIGPLAARSGSLMYKDEGELPYPDTPEKKTVAHHSLR